MDLHFSTFSSSATQLLTITLARFLCSSSPQSSSLHLETVLIISFFSSICSSTSAAHTDPQALQPWFLACFSTFWCCCCSSLSLCIFLLTLWPSAEPASLNLTLKLNCFPVEPFKLSWPWPLMLQTLENIFRLLINLTHSSADFWIGQRCWLILRNRSNDSFTGTRSMWSGTHPSQSSDVSKSCDWPCRQTSGVQENRNISMKNLRNWSNKPSEKWKWSEIKIRRFTLWAILLILFLLYYYST